MRVHVNAKLGPAGRLALVKKVLEGGSLRTAAAESSVSVATAHRWLHRWLDASAQQRSSGAWLEDRSSRPRRSPRRLTSEQEARILRARERTGLGPARLAGDLPAGSVDDLEGALASRGLAAAQLDAAAALSPL